jgi:uncharacterized membrane protein
MKLISTSILVAGLFVFSDITLGHGTESHAEESQAVEQPAVTVPTSDISAGDPSEETPKSLSDDQSDGKLETEHETHNEQSMDEKPAMEAKPDPVSRLGEAIEDFTFDDFPTLHPMVVHVPVIMIPMALLFGLMSIFFTHRHFVALAVAFALTGVLGGYVAAFPMHPHTRGLPEAVLVTLQQHDFFAYSTLGITTFSVVIGAIALLKPNLITRSLLVVTLLLASVGVSVTAHYGGTLTYVHGVGVNGNYLDKH